MYFFYRSSKETTRHTIRYITIARRYQSLTQMSSGDVRQESCAWGSGPIALHPVMRGLYTAIHFMSREGDVLSVRRDERFQETVREQLILKFRA